MSLFYTGLNESHHDFLKRHGYENEHCFLVVTISHVYPYKKLFMEDLLTKEFKIHTFKVEDNDNWFVIAYK